MKLRIEIELEAKSLDEALEQIRGNKNIEVAVSNIQETEVKPMITAEEILAQIKEPIKASAIVEPTQPSETSTTPETVLPTAEAKQYTQEEVARALVQLRDTKGVSEVITILDRFGAKALTQIPQDRYNEVVTILNEKGVKV